MSKTIRVHNLSRTSPPPPRVGYGDSFAARLRGLMFRRALARDEGLLLVERHDSRLDSSIHMFFVPFDLAVFWINSQLTVVDKVLARAWRPAYAPKEAARFTLEINAERLADFEVGDRVEFRDAA